MSKKQIILIVGILVSFIYGLLILAPQELINRVGVFFGIIYMILFIKWIIYDAEQYNFHISNMIKVLLILTPTAPFVFIWYLIKTRKIKTFILLLKLFVYILLNFIIVFIFFFVKDLIFVK
ncbi:MAG: hypothetical protein A2086_14415 [Spirochaetes bacterium GWD1_27_9]|nr:MAG: hypothetical protein A2Z98_04555 [Spirochaetes bacterium GWB1_27_13]OHD26083.1 MAG: hypothetical protein A2Y34_03735 [Spirochaetes bacterium GWC1_27_15]OHD41250.1 MAG: hypothetical protein A2086_14415 [Spirochaetes bacterium GWD1_27_9]